MEQGLDAAHGFHMVQYKAALELLIQKKTMNSDLFIFSGFACWGKLRIGHTFTTWFQKYVF